MKNTFKLLILTSLFLVSCDDNLLEPFTPGALTEEVAVQNSSDLQRLMNVSYEQLFGREEAVFTSVFTDEAGIGFANGGQGRNAEFIFVINNGTAGANDIWDTSYYSLARANRVINFADILTPVDAADAELIKRLKAEALTLRAVCHIRLISYFSPDPKNDAALAGVLADGIITSADIRARSTNGAFYSLIHADLDAAIAIFNTLGPSTNTGIAATYYASKNLATAMKARAYALKGDYPNAEVFANQTIAAGPALATTLTQYNQVFFTDNEPGNVEVIFRLKRTVQQNSQATNMHNGWCSIRPNAAGSPFYEVSRSLFNLMAPPATQPSAFSTISDYRFRTIVAPSSLVSTDYVNAGNYLLDDRLIINKHGGTLSGSPWAATATNGNNNDLKVCRISEMYMIRAEARVAAGDLAGAAAALETVIDARNTVNQPTPVFANATDAWKEILKQRRIEFAFEGYRYVDLKRLGALAGVTIERDPMDYSSPTTNYPGGNPVNLPITSFKWTLPIPISEINANSSIQQNPGY
jgi:starch-binding outer membrane protein, SusD/RagB family